MRKSLFIGLVAVLGLIGCSRNQEIDVADANLSIFARTESPADTKTVVESGVHVYWEPGDEIAVFTGNLSAKFTTDITAASGTTTFKGTFGDATWPEDLDLWAVYPFSEDAVFDGETITTTLPSEQVAREGSFGKDMNLAVAHSTSTSLQFYNVGGGIRFSVTEEGIKKVMFEGLSGEIISGKVKIGFEDGIPVVKEVTGGSQFITLLPPTGKETFEKDTWYYIVAIPGSLEGGYKLRFYKDSDYARKVSEKAAQIKRSIYGSIEQADEGIKYETTTTHFPETLEEWEASLLITKELDYQLDSRFNGVSNIPFNSVSVLEDILRLEEVIDLEYSPDENCLSIMQKDSLVINYLLNNKWLNNPDPLPSNYNSQPKNYITKSATTTNDSFFNNSVNALVLAPVDGSLKEFGANVDSLVNALSYIFDERITVLKGPDADFTKFFGDFLDNYDFIYINTHGGIIRKNSWVRETFGEPLGIESKRTALVTGTKYDSQFIRKYIDTGILNKYSLYLSDVGDTENGEHIKRICMTPEFLDEKALVRDEASFDNTIIMVGACYSADILEGKQSLLAAFFDKGAGACSGNVGELSSPLNAMMNFRIVSAMTNGFSFLEAREFVVNNPATTEYCKGLLNKEGFTSSVSWINPHRIRSGVNVSLPYRFVNPYPFFLNATPKDDQILFEWKSFVRSIHEKWPYYLDDTNFEDRYYHYTVSFDIFVDDIKQEVSFGNNAFVDKTALWSPDSPGEHSWYVVARIMEGDSVIASYQSDKGYFNVPASISVESVSIDKITLELAIGNTATLTATVLPENATNKNVSWTSSNESVASVSSTGEVLGISKGNAIITVTTEDGAKTATCDVTVKDSSVGGDIEGTEEDPWN